jgi:hypothetical protein
MVLTAVVVNVTIFVVIAPFSLCMIQRLGGTYDHHVQGVNMSRARNPRASIWLGILTA